MTAVGWIAVRPLLDVIELIADAITRSVMSLWIDLAAGDIDRTLDNGARKMPGHLRSIAPPASTAAMIWFVMAV